MNPSSEVWFIHLSVITAVQLQQMGWQGASWYHPAQTHTCECAHTCATYTAHRTHMHSQTRTRMCSQSDNHALSFALMRVRTHKSTAAYEVLERKKEKGRGLKVCRGKSPNVFLSAFLIWAFSARFIHSALSAGIWGPRCKHWVYKCFVLFICLPSKPKEATGGEWKWGKREHVSEKMMRWGRNISVSYLRYSVSLVQQFSKLADRSDASLYNPYESLNVFQT